MDLNAYFQDKRECVARLKLDFPNNVVYITSLFHRDRNSTAGNTLSASWDNAARVITDGTHRLATEEEVEKFKSRQQEELRKNTIAEQMNKRQFFVVMPGGVPGQPEVATPTQDRLGDMAASVGGPGGVVAAMATAKRKPAEGEHKPQA